MKTTDTVLLESLALAKDFASELNFDGGFLGHLCAVSLYVTILELIDESLRLVRDGPKPGIPILTRSVFEAFVDLKNLVGDEGYLSVIEFQWLKSWCKLLATAEKGNQYVSQFSEDPNLKTNLEIHQKRLDELKENGVKLLMVYEKFEKAGLKDEYDTIYGVLCSHSHGGLQALIDRHIDTNVEDGNPKVNAFQNRPVAEFEIYLGTMCELLAQATEQINNYLSGMDNELVTAIREMVDAQKNALTST